jgi:hypothetical protein
MVEKGGLNYESVLWRDTVEWLSCTLFPQYAIVTLPSIEKFAVKKKFCVILLPQ